MATRRIKVGGLVSYRIGTRTATARVVHDLGNIGVNHRQLVVVAETMREDQGGGIDEFNMPVEELEVIEPASA